MIDYTALDEFTDTQIYDLSDLVKGGDLGASNIPIKALLDRSLYLLNRLVSYEGIVLQPADYTYDVADKRKLFVFNLSTNATFNLPDVASLRVGSIVPINCYTTGIKALTIQCNGTQKIKGGNFDGTDTSVMYMHNNEKLSLVAAGDHWEIDKADGNFFTVGESVYSRRIVGNCVGTNGTTFNRADMPRLSAYALSLGINQGIISDVIWLTDNINKGFFSTGDGATTLRLPDERGLFLRALDQGRGFDTSRINEYPGGFANDSNKKHNHTETPDTAADANNAVNTSRSNYDFGNIPNGVPEGKPGLIRRSYKTGGVGNPTPAGGDDTGRGFEPAFRETPVNIPFDGGPQSQPKNIGLLNQIRY
ncbi:hypothetical protein [Pinibacter soli]|uniref:Phage tail collar domain-containing protein n=1 Tax=Pinibacter soli TaxID=3044211 RepID=A0ABT6RBS2_9BACT|nr:hypothetical protein [Pinibacter soli]MDI3320002.1 hypothetical protein [Pinibacter soli]